MFKMMWVEPLEIRVTKGLKQPWALGRMVFPLATTICYLQLFLAGTFLTFKTRDWI